MSALSLSALLGSAPRNLFFTGKGGVGKTSLACAAALALAGRGLRVLLVSTDPASNLDEVLETPLAREARPVKGAPLLQALNIDPAQAARLYREKLLAPLRGLLPDSALRSMEEQLSGACTMEIAAFDEFARLLGEPSCTADYDHVIFDTAPTGHTLRLMLLPRAWTHFLDHNTTGSSCLGPLAGLDAQRGVYDRAMKTLADPALTQVILVSRAQNAPLREARRSSEELAQVGIRNQVLVLNALFQAAGRDDAIALAFEERGTRALESHAEFIGSLPQCRVSLRPTNLLGLGTLGELLDERVPGANASGPAPRLPALLSPESLLSQVAESGHGLIMTMGKGGVGKTTLAAALAVALARQGRPVLLSTTDPAAHLVATLSGSLPFLRVSRIDPQEETRLYVAEVLASQGVGLDAASLALLEEDLRSPCTEEVAVFRAFARTVASASEGFVILDTAPTGHTLLLLDATESYHRELGRQARESIPDAVRELLPRLRDPAFTRVLLATLPEATPVHEAAALQEDLRRAGIEPFAWLVNQSFALCTTSDPLLAERARREQPYFEEVALHHSRRTCAFPWLPQEPVGAEALGRFFQPTSKITHS